MRSWDILFDRNDQKVSFTRSQCANEKIHLNAVNHDSHSPDISVAENGSTNINI
jgi:hypothetical protein